MSAPRHILITVDPEIPVPPLHYGGIERVVDTLASGLAARGFKITLAANAHSTCKVALLPWPGKSSGSSLDTIRNSLALTGFVARHKVDLIHSLSRVAYLAPLLPLSVPKLMSYHRQINPFSSGFGRLASMGSLHFSAISEWMMPKAVGKSHWHHIPNPVPVSHYDFQPTAAPDAPFVFLGRIEEIKGPHLAIEIARKAGRKLVIAGNIEPEHKAWAEIHILPHVDGDRVAYSGVVDDNQKNELLGSAAALLMPILWDEPFGLVMTEAMACGTPVLALNRGGVPEIVDPGVTGFYADTVEELVQLVPRLTEISRAACRARVERLYGDERFIDRNIEVYEAILGR